MTSVDVRTREGAGAGTVELDAGIFGVQPNVPVMHQVVNAQLAARRSGTHNTKTRAEVRGGGKKPWRQKGTGRARQGSTRAPHWSGGGVAMGPKPRDYRQKTPKKMIQLALRSALSDRASEGRVAVVEAWDFPEPKTKHGVAALRALGLDGRVLVVVADGDDAAVRAFRNLPEVQLLLVGELNAYDVLCNDWLVFTRATLPRDVSTNRPESAGSAQTSAPVADPSTTSDPVADAAPTAEPVADAAPTAEPVSTTGPVVPTSEEPAG